MQEHPPGLVGVIAQDTARYSMFGASLTGLAVPAGTKIKWQIGHDIASNQNILARLMLAQPELEWLMILGDDHVFAPDLLNRLLDVSADIVVPLCLTRLPPYKPVAFTDFVDGGPYRRRLNLDLIDGGGVLPIHSAGTAGMVIRRPVLEAMTDPWFEIGKVSSQEIGEDIWFCDKARVAGASLYVDIDTPLGHCTTGTVWPTRTPEGWTYGVALMGGLRITMPVGSWEEAEEIAMAGVA